MNRKRICSPAWKNERQEFRKCVNGQKNKFSSRKLRFLRQLYCIFSITYFSRDNKFCLLKMTTHTFDNDMSYLTINIDVVVL